MKESLKIILIFFIISLIPTVFYYNLYLFNSENFDPNIILQSNFIWDEQTSYFLRADNLLQNKSFGVNEIDNNFKFSSMSISLIVFSLLKILLSSNYFPIYIDIILSFGFLITVHLFFIKILKLDKFYSCLFSIIFLILFSIGPTTINFFLEIFKNMNLKSMPYIYRQISPSMTSIFLVLFIFLNFKYFQSNKKKILIFTPLFYFIYPFNSLIQITGSFLFSFYFLFKKKYKNQKIFYFLSLNLFSFFLWYLLNQLESNWFSKFLLGATYDLIFDKRNFIIIFFFCLNFLLYRFYKIEKFIYLNLSFLTVFIVYNAKFLIGYDLQFYHVDMYFSKPLQWINIFYITNIIFNKLVYKRIIALFSFVFIVFFILSFNNYSQSILKKNEKYLYDQLKFKKDLIEIKYLINGKTILTLDPNFIFYGYNYVNSKNYIFYSARNLEISPEINLKRFIDTCIVHGINDLNKIESIFLLNKNEFKYDLHGVFHELIFLEDGPASANKKNTYKSLQKNKTFSNLREVIKNYYHQKNSQNTFQDQIILINKNSSIKNIMKLEKLKLIFENNAFILYKL